MEITLEKIELVKDRTGCTYAQAKEALEKAEGNEIDAIVALEEEMTKDYSKVDGESLNDSPVFAKIKEIVEKGNMSRILISKDDKTILNFPLTAGVIGAVLVPWGAILGIIAAMGTQCSIDFVDDKGKVIDVDGKVIGIYDKAKGIVVKGVSKVENMDRPETFDELKSSIETIAKKASKTVKEFVSDPVDSYKTSEADEIIEEELNEDDL